MFYLFLILKDIPKAQPKPAVYELTNMLSSARCSASWNTLLPYPQTCGRGQQLRTLARLQWKIF